MPDLLDFDITPLGAVSVSVPRASIEARVVDSSDQSIVLADFTGANAIVFPQVILTLTPAQRLQMARLLAMWLIRLKAGLSDPDTGL